MTKFGKFALLGFQEMMRMITATMDFGRILILWVFGFSAVHAAEIDGKAQYEMLCGACHNPDGKGAGEGAFPPLAGSEWVKGDPERMVQVILHGLTGPVTVLNKTYNLAMPPQGGALTDEQIAAITAYVRGAWGNDEPGVDVDFVKKARENTLERKTMWEAEELLKRWPLPKEIGPLENLRATIFKGSFQAMPDFSKLTPHSVEESENGFISLDLIPLQNDFAVVWEGDFRPKETGDYAFQLDSDDGSRLFVNGLQVAEVKGVGPLGRKVQGQALLENDVVRIRVEYFEGKGKEGITLAAKRGKNWTYFTKDVTEGGPQYQPALIVAKDEARLYRNFIKGTTARAIGVGYPEEVNLTFSADELGIGVAWIGDFIDAGLHWTGRGQGFQSPAGQRVVGLGGGPAFARDVGELSPWPKRWQPELKAQFEGYILDKKRRPEFRYSLAGLQVSDKPMATADRKLVRNIRLQAGDNPPQGLSLRLSKAGAKAIGSHAFELGSGVRLEIAKSDIAQPVVTKDGVVLRLKLKAGENRIGVRYVWK